MILVIDNYDSFVYNLVHYVEDFGVRAEVVRNDALTRRGRAEEETESGDPLAGAAARRTKPASAWSCWRKAPDDLPMFGVCLGHQAMGQAFGGEVVSARKRSCTARSPK